MSRVRTPCSDGAIYVGPLEARGVQALMDAARDALTIHRCSTPARCHGCVFSQMGRCSGLDPARHIEDLRRLAVALEFDPNGLLEPVLARMKALAGAERFEEAAEVRERGALLERTLVHRLEHAALVRAGDVVLTVSGRALWLRSGRLAGAADLDRDGAQVKAWILQEGPADTPAFTTAGAAREGRVIASWLRRNLSDVRILHVSGTWSWPIAGRARALFRPARDPRATSASLTRVQKA
jgi:DNA polymerase-3 subunit epsilon